MAKEAKKDVPSVHECFRWLYYSLWKLGSMCFYIEKTSLKCNTSSIVQMYVIRFALLSGFIGGVVLKLNDPETQKMFAAMNAVPKFVLGFESISCVLTYLEITLKFDSVRRKYLKYVTKLQSMDDYMVDIFPAISWNYRKTLRKFTGLAIILITTYSLMALIFVFNLMKIDLISTMIAFSYVGISTTNGFMGAVHTAHLDILRIRYRLLSKLANEYFLCERTVELYIQLHLKTLLAFTKKYIKAQLDVNELFGFICATSTFYGFCLITCITYLICQFTLNPSTTWIEYVFAVVFMSPRLYILIATAGYGQVCHKEKENCIHTVFSIVHSKLRSNEAVKNLQESLLYWKMHNNYTITIGQDIPCRLNVLFAVLNGIVNYVLILIQLQFQQYRIEGNIRTDLKKNIETVDVHK